MDAILEEVFKETTDVSAFAGFLVERVANTTNEELIAFALSINAHIEALPYKERNEATRKLSQATGKASKHPVYKERMVRLVEWQRADPKNKEWVKQFREETIETLRKQDTK